MQDPNSEPQRPKDRTVRVWDVPVRVLHWTLAASFLLAIGLAALSPKHSTAFALHPVFGLLAVFAVVLRIVWGFVGSRYARFGSFLYGPRAVMGYFREALGRRDIASPGHNPGSSYAILAMLLGPVLLAVTGLAGEAGEEVHEAVAYLTLAVVVLHLVGIGWHTLRHKENIAFSMWSGLRPGKPEDGIQSSHPVTGVAFAVGVAAFALLLFRGFDATKRELTLPVVGTKIALGEDEGGEHEGKGERHEKRKGDHDDDD
ncbi:MAG: cytochrome b/b6 domain-containing protein [Polyangiaceae bacterium]